jgi:hypothetical protein
VRLGHEMSMHNFLGSGGTGAVSKKNASGHVMSNLWFAFGGICRSFSAFQCVRGVQSRCTIFHARVVLVRILQKA